MGVIVDASAVLAILLDEPEGDDFLNAILTAPTASMSVVNHLEVAIRVDRYPDPAWIRRADTLIERSGIEMLPVTVEQAAIARAAYRDFGRGSGHPAKLNMGDCFAYALATTRQEPLLYKGDDFIHTDIRSAI